MTSIIFVVVTLSVLQTVAGGDAESCTYELMRGEKLYVGERLCSLGKDYTAFVQDNGNLVLKSKISGSTLWMSDTYGQDVYLTMEDDGTLALMDAQDNRKWFAEGTVSGERAVVHGDGSLLVYDGYNDVIWSSAASSLDMSWCRSLLWEEMVLFSGQALCSADLQYKAVMRSDGNFVIYHMPDQSVVWNTGTSGEDLRLMLQVNGELTIRDKFGESKWSSNKYGQARYLVMQDDGNLVVGGKLGQVVWASGSSQQQW